jgi:hypothetical protein
VFRKFISTVLAVLVICVSLNPVCAASDNKKPRSEAKIRAAVVKLGTGPAAHVEVTLHDKTKLKGFVSEASDDSFVVVDTVTGMRHMIPYPQVKKVKGHNLSNGAKVAIGFGIAFVVLVLVFRDHINAY